MLDADGMSRLRDLDGELLSVPHACLPHVCRASTSLAEKQEKRFLRYCHESLVADPWEEAFNSDNPLDDVSPEPLQLSSFDATGALASLATTQTSTPSAILNFLQAVENLQAESDADLCVEMLAALMDNAELSPDEVASMCIGSEAHMMSEAALNACCVLICGLHHRDHVCTLAEFPSSSQLSLNDHSSSA